MALAKEKPRFETPTDYEDDYYLWLNEQAELLRQKRFAEIDLPNLIEELEAMGRGERRKLMSALRLLMMHLLKYQYQPAKRSRSWLVTINNNRDEIDDSISENPSFARDLLSMATEIYPKAVRAAATETGLDPATFPATCPFTVEQLRDHDFLPA